jgi:hypothetical protein
LDGAVKGHAAVVDVKIIGASRPVIVALESIVASSLDPGAELAGFWLSVVSSQLDAISQTPKSVNGRGTSGYFGTISAPLFQTIV